MADVRFVVHKTNDVDGIDGGSQTIAIEKANKYDNTEIGESAASKEAQPLNEDDIDLSDDSCNGDDRKFHLYEEEFNTRPPMSSLFSKLANYTGGIEPTSAETQKLKEKSENKLGTVLGVFFPCIQNIFGVLYFVRLVWIIGCSGPAQGIAIVFICCCTTMLTILSMSAIATNGKVPAGGSYFMISRSLGPEFGGTVGILFYIGTTIASAMYIIGAIEVLLNYIAPSASLFGPIESDPSVLFNNTRVYGVILLCILMGCVFIGIKFVSKFATVSLACVIISILCVYIGIFASHPSRSPKVCMLGPILLSRDILLTEKNNDSSMVCSKEPDSPLYILYCGNSSHPINGKECDFLKSSNVTEIPAFPGFYKPLLVGNFVPSYYSKKGHMYGKPNVKITEEKKKLGQYPIAADITLSFTILLAIFFPSVTGIMAGSNRSGDLANPGYSIPVGSIAACATTSIVYLSSVILFAATIDHNVMRDKFGLSLGGGLIIAKLAWPNHWVILIGSFLSTVGAGLQSLTGAPRLLQAIAQDNVIPILEPLKVTTNRGEPLRAQAVTFVISFLSVLIASIDHIAPLITMFFLMCYGFVNLATALNSLLNEPHWRPRFRYYHWTTSVIGLILCVALMFVSSWVYALVSIAMAGGIYKYIEYRGAAKEWGDATRGFRMSAAKKSILQLGHKPIHTKNWRPQILLLVHMSEDKTTVNKPKLFDFCSQLKAGKGLTIVGTVIEGELVDKKDEMAMAKETLNRFIREKRIQGLSEVIVAPNPIEGLKVLCQSAGLGNLRHNCVLLNFPERWLQDESHLRWKQFMATIRCSQASDLAVLVTKGINKFPSRKKPRKIRTIGNTKKKEQKKSDQTNSDSTESPEHVGNNKKLKNDLDNTNNDKDIELGDVVKEDHNKVNEHGDTNGNKGIDEANEDDDDENENKVIISTDVMDDLIYEMTGTIDMWCVVHDGGLLMLLSHLLIHARAWNKCLLRIFVVALETDNTITLKKEVVQFVYDLRIKADVEVVELEQADISAYVLQRTMDMTMRKKLLANMNLRSGDSKREFQCILDKHHLVTGGDAGAVGVSETVPTSYDMQPVSSPPPTINVTNQDNPSYEKKPNQKEDSTTFKVAQASSIDETTGGASSPTDTNSTAAASPPAIPANASHDMKTSSTAQTLLLNTPDATPLQNQRSVTFANPGGPEGVKDAAKGLISPERMNEFTFTPGALQNMKLNKTTRRMHSAVRLNEMIRSRSKDASLVVLNLPGPSKNESSDYNYMEYVETLTDGIERILLVRGTGKEVITAYSE